MAGTQAMIVAGIGCRKDAPVDSIEEVIRVALSQGGLAWKRLDALATHYEKRNEPGLQGVARKWSLILLFPEIDALEVAAKYTATVSPRSLAALGVPSVAETAALAAVGSGARLLVPRVVNKNATCAIAAGDGP
jgi:cobalt-precorrin 5A hydrolase